MRTSERPGVPVSESGSSLFADLKRMAMRQRRAAEVNGNEIIQETVRGRVEVQRAGRAGHGSDPVRAQCDEAYKSTEYPKER